MMKVGQFSVLIVACLVFAALGAEYRTNDGSNNNLRDPTMGRYLEYQVRQRESNFADLDSPNARTISNSIGAEPNEFVNANPQGVNLFEAFVGQFINHDKEFSRTTENNTFYQIQLLDTSDVLYGANATNNVLEIGISASVIDRLTPRGPLEPQIVNHATAWLDLSALYGNNDAQVSAMRALVGGRLKTSNYTVFLGPFPTVLANHLPSKAATGLENITPLTVPPSLILTAGDARVNENVGLALVTTIFLREHNRIAGVLASANPSWSDETLFQEARRLNVAQYQNMIVKEYLPAIVSNAHLDRFGSYRGYKRNTEGGTSLEFSLGAFRYGHSVVKNFPLVNNSGCLQTLSVPGGVFGPVGFSTPVLPFAGQVGGAFAAPFAFAAVGGVQNILNGLLNTRSNMVDTRFTNAVRNIEFIGAFGRGVDLLAFDIIRGRMNGLSSYHELRRRWFAMERDDDDLANIYNADDCDASPTQDDQIDPLACFLHITSDVALATKLRDIYGKVTKIDGFVGLLAEDHLAGSFLPRTLANIVIDEYKRSRDADRFWFEREGILTEQEMAAVKARSFAQIVRDAFPELANVQEDIFRVRPGFFPTLCV